MNDNNNKILEKNIKTYTEISYKDNYELGRNIEKIYFC